MRTYLMKPGGKSGVLSETTRWLSCMKGTMLSRDDHVDKITFVEACFLQLYVYNVRCFLFIPIGGRG